MTPPVSQQVFLPGECLAAVQAVVRPLRLYPHVELQVPVEMFPPAVSLSAALVRAVKEGRVGGTLGRGGVVSVGVQGVQHSHGDGAVSVSLLPGLPSVVRQSDRTAGPVEVPLVADQMLLPLEILATLRAPERSLRLLAQMSHLR